MDCKECRGDTKIWHKQLMTDNNIKKMWSVQNKISIIFCFYFAFNLILFYLFNFFFWRNTFIVQYMLSKFSNTFFCSLLKNRNHCFTVVCRLILLFVLGFRVVLVVVAVVFCCYRCCCCCCCCYYRSQLLYYLIFRPSFLDTVFRTSPRRYGFSSLCIPFMSKYSERFRRGS